ncbi:hypothetical protein Tco_0891227 [Tanacetum coccineum]|uniref:Reverse transcriptase domain-containing protein n=1 Tax=Tanacetum coccineum TaxID=301880 RepID=A0ABQ5C2M6_9ASTR
MRTRSQARRRRQPQVRQTSVESSNLEKPDNPPIVTMADNRTMAQLLESTHEGQNASRMFKIIESKLLRYVNQLNKAGVAKMSTKLFHPIIVSSDVAELKDLCEKHAKPWSKPAIPNANLTDMLSKFVTANTASTSGSGTLPGNTVTNPKEDLKGITTRSGVTIQGPKAVNHDAEVTKDTMPPANNGSTEDVQPPVVQIQSRNPNPEPNVAPVVTPIPKASIPFPSRRNDERRKEKANDQIEKFYEIFRDLSFEISFTDALMLCLNLLRL